MMIYIYYRDVVITLLLCIYSLPLKVLFATIDAQWEGMGDVGSARYKSHYFPHARP